MSPRSVRRLTAVVVAASALALSACGGDDDQDFVDAATKASADISAIGQDIGTTVTGAEQETDAELARAFDELAARVGRSVDALEDLDPPNDELSTTVDELSTALEKGQQDLEAIATAAKASDAGDARRATQALVRDSPAISAGNRKLKEQTAALEEESG